MNRRSFIKGCICGSLAGILYLGTRNKSIFNENKDYTELNCVEIHLTDHCNLNCKYCCHFSSIAEKYFYDLSQFKNDIARLADITKSRIYQVKLMGGEPLLNPEINKYIKITRKYFPNSEITLYTNGLLLSKMDDSFWHSLEKYKITLLPSFYKVEVDWKTVLLKAQKYNVEIPFDYAGYIETFDNINLDLKGSQKNLSKCKDCYIAHTYTVYLGKIYACPVMAYIKYFNKKFNQNVEVTDNDYLELDKIKNIQQIIDYGESPKSFCRYCRDFYRMPWENSKTHTMSEWGSYD